MTLAVMLQGTASDVEKRAGGGTVPHFSSGWAAYRAV
jgi:hypothetical protein